jgi:hypothetical protein
VNSYDGGDRSSFEAFARPSLIQRPACVGAHAAHNGRERTLGHLAAFVQRFAAADSGYQIGVLLLVRAGRFALVFVRVGAVDFAGIDCSPQVRRPEVRVRCEDDDVYVASQEPITATA